MLFQREVNQRFMQLNPARGRKHIARLRDKDDCIPKVYAAQPREGTETGNEVKASRIDLTTRVYAAQPREGTETKPLRSSSSRTTSMVYAAQPREGTETQCNRAGSLPHVHIGLCSSTPRGDGNFKNNSSALALNCRLVYAAQPREGTETI